jgi:hypothetical protein
MKKTLGVLVCSIFLIPFCLRAQQQSSTKYSLFHPVPKEQLREMQPDRPGITESPFTVDAGHFQYEADLFSLEKQNMETQVERTILINHFNIKAGLTSSTALQLGYESFGTQQDRDVASGAKTTSHGAGNINVRIKQNLVGNDAGNFTMALLPYINIPTSTYDDEARFEEGFIVPMQYKFPGEWELGMQLEADRLKDAEANGLHTEFLQSLSLTHELIKDLDGIAETHYTYNFKEKSWANFLDAALQYGLSKNFMVDAGLNYGLQHDAEKRYYVGLAFRL